MYRYDKQKRFVRRLIVLKNCARLKIVCSFKAAASEIASAQQIGRTCSLQRITIIAQRRLTLVTLDQIIVIAACVGGV